LGKVKTCGFTASEGSSFASGATEGDGMADLAVSCAPDFGLAAVRFWLIRVVNVVIKIRKRFME
jgi:hypothetical protein